MESLLLHSFIANPIFNNFSAFRQLSYLVAAKHYMTEVFQCKVEPSLMACRQFCEFQIQFSRKPMLREFIQFVYRPCSLACEYITPIDPSIQIMEHLFVEQGIISNCQLVYFCYTYLQFEQRYPTDTELTVYIETEFSHILSQDDSEITQWMNQDVEEYWNRKRSTIDLTKLTTEVASDEKSPCCICQESIDNGQLLIRLPCHHTFHSQQGSNCSGIEPWLQKSDTCPLCKKSTTILPKKDTEEDIPDIASDPESEEDIPDFESDSDSEENSIYIYSTHHSDSDSDED